MVGKRIKMDSLKNKNVLVTGSSSGIGASIAESFAKEGANIGIHYWIGKEGAEDLADKLAKLTKVKIYQQDLGSDELDLVHKFVKNNYPFKEESIPKGLLNLGIIYKLIKNRPDVIRKSSTNY